MPYSGTIIKAAEETKARTVEATGKSKNSNSPAYTCASYDKQLPDVQLIRKVYGGTKTMRLAGEEFLPQHPMEPEGKYDARREQAVAYNALKKTEGGLNGMIFRRDPTYSEDVPEELKGTDTTNGDLDNIDRQGNAFPVFWRYVADNALTDGHTWVWVESPPNPATTEREEEELEIRPYWVNLKKEQVTNWRYEIRNGKPVLTLIAFREGAVEPDGDFGEKQRQRIRVLREVRVTQTDDVADARTRVQGELWEYRKRDDTGLSGRQVDRWVEIERYLIDLPVTEIPVVIVYAGKTDLYESAPPLLDLAYEQIEHYRVRSDRQKSMTFSSIAVPFMFGEGLLDDEDKPKVVWGADGMAVGNDPNTNVGMMESHGYGLDATDRELERIEGRMASMGLALIASSQTVQPRTATEEAINKGENDAWLALFAQNLEDGANQCTEIHGTYRGLDVVGKIQLSREFYDQLIDPQMLRELNNAVAAGNLSFETLFEELKHGRVLHVQHDAAEERARIEQDDAAGMATADRDMRIQELEARLAQMGEQEEVAADNAA